MSIYTFSLTKAPERQEPLITKDWRKPPESALIRIGESISLIQDVSKMKGKLPEQESIETNLNDFFSFAKKWPT